jgi:hypothetical protein
VTGFHTGGTASSDASILDELRKRRSSHGTVMAVSMTKDEAPFLLEWFAHQLAIAFKDILVYTNDCTDGTDETLQRLETMGLGHHREGRTSSAKASNHSPLPSSTLRTNPWSKRRIVCCSLMRTSSWPFAIPPVTWMEYWTMW